MFLLERRVRVLCCMCVCVLDVSFLCIILNDCCSVSFRVVCVCLSPPLSIFVCARLGTSTFVIANPFDL